MKIYEKIVIDMATGETIEEQAYEYAGPVAELKGGKGSVPSTTTTEVTPAPQLPDKGVQQAATDQRTSANAATGAAATILTGPQGDLTEANTQKKTLLGQ